MKRTLIAWCLLALSSASVAEPTYIQAGRLIAVPGITPRGASTIVVDQGRIVEVRDGFVTPPAKARLVDLRGKTVLPGLIDAHVHLDSDRAGLEAAAAAMSDSAELRALETQWNGLKTLNAGFTTVRNLGDRGGTLALREAIVRGWVKGPRIVDAGESISTTGGHMDFRNAVSDELAERMPAPDNLCDGVEQCRKVVRHPARGEVIKGGGD